MEILFKDKYKITADKYCWTLHVGSEVTQEHFDSIQQRNKKSGKKTNISIGDITWADEGYFTNLQTLFQKIIRMEAESDDTVIQIQDFLIRWGAVMSEFENYCKVKKQG